MWYEGKSYRIEHKIKKIRKLQLYDSVLIKLLVRSGENLRANIPILRTDLKCRGSEIS